MPWTPDQFRSRHNKKLNASQSDHAAAQANALLRSGVDEGEAIAVANKYADAHPNKSAPHKSRHRLVSAIMRKNG